MPRWSPDGKELFYSATGGTLMAVSITPLGASIQIRAPDSLFALRGPLSAIVKEGRFLSYLNIGTGQRGQAPITPDHTVVIHNWPGTNRRNAR